MSVAFDVGAAEGVSTVDEASAEELPPTQLKDSSRRAVPSVEELMAESEENVRAKAEVEHARVEMEVENTLDPQLESTPAVPDRDADLLASHESEARTLEKVFHLLDYVAGVHDATEESSDLEAAHVEVKAAPPAERAGLATLRSLTGRLLAPKESYQVFTPYVRDPRWGKAMILLKEDECEEALKFATAVLGSAKSNRDGEPAIAYAFGRMQMCAGQESAGRATLRELAKEPGAVGELSRRRLGLSALPTSEIEDPGMSLARTLQQARDAARKSGKPDPVLHELRELRAELSGGWDRYRVRQAEAQILEDAGRIDETVQVYLGIYRMTRHWRSGDRIVADIENAEQRLKRTIIPFGDRVDRMRELIARGRYSQGRALSVENVKIRAVSGSEVQGWTAYRVGLQAEHERKREFAAEKFEEAEKLIKDDEIRSRLYFDWARALRRLDRDREAIALYERLCDEYPAHLLCDQSLYEAGRLLQYLNEHERARDKFFQVVGLHPFSEYVPDALWRAALSAYLVKDYQAAIAPLMDIVNHYGDQQDASELTLGLKARYWIGVSWLKSGDRHRGARWLQETINSGTLTWYGRLAVARMEEAGMKPEVRLPESRLTAAELRELSTLRIPENPRLAVATELIRLGMWADALAEVRAQIGVHPIPDGAPRLRAALHLVNDEPNWAHWLMKSEIQESGPQYATLRDWGTAFPLDYMEFSHKYGNSFGVSPFLVQAIIRQESGFRPDVRSPAGATGLMQLMPGTARYTSRVFLDERTVRNNEMNDPDTNVRLGTMYIRVHTAYAADQIPLALAGYNAGPAPLKSWFERYGDRELDAWVESITYREARGYVRKVMTSYITYAGLYGDGTLPDINLEMPEKLGRWGTVPEVKQIKEGEPVSLAW